MKRARTGFCLAVAAAAPLLAVAPQPLAPLRPVASEPIRGLTLLEEPPELLPLPFAVAQVGFDFAPPLPGDEPSSSVGNAGTPLPVETRPQGLYGPALAAPRVHRLPPVERQQAALPPRESPLLVERLPPIQEPVTAAPPVERVEQEEQEESQQQEQPPPQQESPQPIAAALPPAKPEPISRQPSPMAAVSEHALGLTEHAAELADRGAFFSARAEFIQALRVMTQALDTQNGTTIHSEALAEGLRALEEAGDFSPPGSQLEADLDLPSIVAGHRTPVLKDENLEFVTPLAALQRYYGYAQSRLAVACADQPAASQALFGLGKLTTLMAARSSESRRVQGPQAIALHNAALSVDGQNYRAANELAVLLAGYGQWREAKQVLLHSLEIEPTVEAWHNLAMVHERLGERDLAAKAKYEVQLARRDAQRRLPGGVPVEWVDASAFAGRAPAPTAPAVESAARPANNFFSNPWLK